MAEWLWCETDGKGVGCLRILTDGYFFGTITELLILPVYQKGGSVDIGQAGQLGMQLLLSEAAAIGAVIGASVSWIFKRYLANKEWFALPLWNEKEQLHQILQRPWTQRRIFFNEWALWRWSQRSMTWITRRGWSSLQEGGRERSLPPKNFLKWSCLWRCVMIYSKRVRR